MFIVSNRTAHSSSGNVYSYLCPYREGALGNSLPISERVDKREQLRRERQAEYKEFLSAKRQETNVRRERTSSVAEARRRLAEERDAELVHFAKGQRDADEKRSQEQQFQGHTHLVDRADGRPPHREETYEEMKARKQREERRYRASMMDYWSPQSSQDTKGASRVVRFEDECSTPPPPAMERRGARRTWVDSGVHLPTSNWDEEDDRYLKWAKNRGRYSTGTHRSQSSASLHQRVSPATEAEEGSRIMSAPSKQNSGGVLNLGQVVTEEERKAKQRVYAEELRQQMRQRNEEQAKGKVHQRRATHEIVIESPDKDNPPLVPKRTEMDQRSSGRTSSHLRYKSSSPEPQADKWYNQESPHYTESYSAHHRQPRWGSMYPPPPNPSGMPAMPYYPHPYPPPIPQYPQQGYYYPPVPPIPPPHHYPYPYPYEGYSSRGKGASGSPVNEEIVRQPSRERQREKGFGKVTLDVPSPHDSPQASLQLKPSPPQGRVDKSTYRAELEKQIREKKERDHKEEMKHAELEMKKDAEIAEYNPWGKGGGGAPIRQPDGRVVADLRKMHQQNAANINNRSPGTQLVVNLPEDPPLLDSEQPSRRDTSRLGHHTPYLSHSPNPAEQPQPHISPQEMYRMELQRQIEEKEEVKRREAEKQRLEEEKEAKRLEAERRKLQEDYERELENQKRKEEEVKAKNEAMRLAAEEKRKAAEHKADEHERREREELARKVREEEEELHRRQTRAPSPPVPTVRNQLKQQGYSYRPPSQDSVSSYRQATPVVQQFEHRTERRDSPPVPALRHKAGTRIPTHTDVSQYTTYHTVTAMGAPPQPPQQEPAQPQNRIPSEHGNASNDFKPLQPVVREQLSRQPAQGESSEAILEKLMAMRRVLTKEQAPPVVAAPRKKSGRGPFDPVRVDLKKLSSGSASSLVQQERQPPTSQATGAPDPIVQFNKLKYGGEADQGGRRELLSLFPEPPRSGSALEIQQAQLLRHQQDSLARLQLAMKHHGATAELNKENNPGAPVGMLSSTTVHVEAGADVHRPNSSRKSRRRKFNIGANFGSEVRGGDRPASQSSFSSFDVESVAERNQHRLHKLESVLRASKESTDQSPDEVVEQFLEKRAPYAPELNRHEPLSRMSERSMQAFTTHHPVYPASSAD